MRHATLTAVLLVAALGMGAIHAHATTISLNGNTVLSDTYEGDTVGSAAIADIGTWSNDGSFWWSPRTKGVVTNSASPGPFEGTQYASLGGTPPQQLSVNLTLALGDVIQFDSMVYIPAATSAASFPWQFVVFGGSNAPANRLLDFYRNADGTWASGSVAGTYAGPASYAADAWQHWVLDYTVGAPNATLTIDGVSALITASNTNLGGSSGLLTWFTNGSSLTYFDAVPEPNSSIILAIGAGGFAVVARRKRV